MGGSSTFVYDLARQRLSSVTGTGADSYGYDDNGNLMTSNSSAFTYTPNNMLASATIAGEQSQYTYDHQDNRVLRATPTGTSFYTYGPGGLMAESCTTDLAVAPIEVRDYIHAGARLVASIKGDPRGTVDFSLASGSASEGAGLINLTVKLAASAALPFDLKVRYRTIDGTAQAPGDYTAASGIITFPQGAHNGATQVVSIPVANDGLDEGDETFTVVLYEPGCGAALGAQVGHQVTLFDEPSVAIDVAGSTPSVQEAGVQARARIKLSTGHALASQLTVRCTTAAGTATSGSDFQAVDQILTFPVNSTSGATQDCLVSIVNDTSVEPDEAFAVSLSGVVGGHLGSLPAIGVTILDDDATLSFVSAGSTAPEAGGPPPTAAAAIRLTTSHGLATTNAVSVTFGTQDGTALAGSDYNATSGLVSFPTGTASNETMSATVQLIDDSTDEPDQTFLVNVAGPTGGAWSGTSSHQVTILDDDSPPTLSIGPASAVEGDSGVTVASAPLTLSQASEWSISADFATGTTGTASAASDFYARSGRLTLTPGATSGSVQVPVLGDRRFESHSEWFPITLGNPDRATLANASAVVTITDDDTPGLTAEDVVAPEGGTATVRVTLWPTIGQGEPPATVDYATAPGTADASDFRPVSGTLVFNPGKATGLVSIPIGTDGSTELTETFTFNLSNPTGGAGVSVPQATVSIVERIPGTDFNNDACSDILWRNSTTGAARAWFVDQAATKIGEAPLTPSGIADLNWRVVGTGSFQPGGQSDVLWRHEVSGNLVVWLMNGVNRTSGAFTNPASAANADWRVMGTGDYNQDGKSDIVWRNSTSGRVVVWLMNGLNQTSGNFTVPDGIADLNWQLVGTGDFNADSKPDLLWRHALSGKLVAWLMDGLTRTQGLFLDPDAAALDWQVVATRDFTFDGRTDVLVRHQVTGQLRVWQMNGIYLRAYLDAGLPSEPDLAWQVAGPR